MPGIHRRRWVLALAAAGVACAMPAAGAIAQTYPDKPISMVLPYPAGGVTDLSGRSIAERLSQELGQPIVVLNRPGAASTVASNWVARQPADGYLLYAAPVSLAVNPALQAKVEYDPEKDFEPVSMMIDAPFILQVNPSVKAGNMAELLDLLRANPGKYSIGTSGVGAINHLAAEYFVKHFDLDLTIVHYRGGIPASQDLLVGDIQLMFSAASEALPLVKSDRTRAIAVTSANRMSILPELPTVQEAAGIDDFEAVFWPALMAPAGTPQPVLERLQQAMAAAGKDDGLRKKLAEAGVELNTSDPAEVRRRLKEDGRKWGELITELGIKEGS